MLKKLIKKVTKRKPKACEICKGTGRGALEGYRETSCKPCEGTGVKK